MNKKLLRIDLTNKVFTVEDLDDSVIEKYLGGLGLALFYFTKEVSSKVDALYPENKLIFSTGPLTGTPLSSSGRVTVLAKSPINQGLGESHAGTRWGAELKMAGYDILIIEGKAKKPVYIYIDDEKVEIENAGSLWGLDTFEVSSELYLKYGRIKNLVKDLGQTSLAVIGISGENQIPYSSIFFEKHRAAGACGMGAVMGSKNLKAIVVRGEKEPTFSNSEDFNTISKLWQGYLEAEKLTGEILPKIGTGFFFDQSIQKGIMMVCSYIQENPEILENYQVENLINIENFNDSPCSDLCKISKCGKYVTLDEESYYVPQFASLWALGPNLGLKNYREIIELNQCCNLLGLDTVQFSNVMNLLMRATKLGLLEDENSQYKIDFNDFEKLKEFARNIATKGSLAKVLEGNILNLAQNLNLLSLLLQINGLGITGFNLDLGADVDTQALSYVTSLVSGAFNKSFHFVKEIFDEEKITDEEAKIDNLIFLENYYALIDSLVICKFSTFAFMDHKDRYGLKILSDAISAGIGIQIDPENLIDIGERIINLQHYYNKKSGIQTFSEIPDSLFDSQVNSKMINKEDFMRQLNLYLSRRNWSNTEHIPLEEQIKKLNINEEILNIKT